MVSATRRSNMPIHIKEACLDLRHACGGGCTVARTNMPFSLRPWSALQYISLLCAAGRGPVFLPRGLSVRGTNRMHTEPQQYDRDNTPCTVPCPMPRSGQLYEDSNASSRSSLWQEVPETAAKTSRNMTLVPESRLGSCAAQDPHWTHKDWTACCYPDSPLTSLVRCCCHGWPCRIQERQAHRYLHATGGTRSS